MKTYLIINADDFGRTIDINRGILKAYQHGVVSSTTVMANFPAFENAVELIKKYDIPVGLHFNLTEGQPVSGADAVPSLLDSNGQFFRKYEFYRRLLMGRFSTKDIERELRAQLHKCFDYGLTLDHYDGHHHVHALKRVAPVCRSLDERIFYLPLRRISWPHNSQTLSSKFQQGAIHLFEDKRPSTVEFSTKFWGFDFMDRDDKLDAFTEMLKNLTPGVHEMMCHPGYENGEAIGYYSGQREQEVDVLCDENIKRKIAESNIELVSYRDISSGFKR